jgi:dCTP diphosphatase
MSVESADRLDALLESLRAFVKEREWSAFHDPKNLAMAVASEAGELVQELRWVPNTESDAHCSGPARDRIADEVGDVLITVLLFCDRIGLDPAAAVQQKLAKNAKKYPVELSRGRAQRPQK